MAKKTLGINGNCMRIAFGAVSVAMLTGSGCSLRKAAIGEMTSFLQEAETVFASEVDPGIVEDSMPLALKIMETALLEDPSAQSVRLSLASGYTKYSYAFVERKANELSDVDFEASEAERDRARMFYARAKDYAWEWLENRQPGIRERLPTETAAALSELNRADAPGLYWLGVAWAAEIGLSLDDPIALVDLPIVESVVDRVIELDADYGAGDLYTFMITFASADPAGGNEGYQRAEEYFDLAVEASDGAQAGPYVAMAKSVCIPLQDRERFEALLKTAIALDVDLQPEERLANVIAQEEARRLLEDADSYFWR